MKKSLLKSAVLGLALMASTSAYADVKLVFNGYDSDSSDSGASWTTSSELSTVFLEGAEYVASIDECSKVYAARNIANGHDFGGAKFGSSSAAGVLTFTLAEPVNAKKIIVTAAPYGASEGQTGFFCNDVETPMPDGQNKIYEDYEISLDGSALSTISLKQVKADKGRFYVKSITLVEEASEAAGWDGTVSTSLDGTTVTSLADLAGMTITFNGATSVVALGEEEAQYLILQNEDGSEMYGLWAPAYGSTCTVEGNVVTLDEFITIEGATGPIPAGTTTLYIEDYGTFVIDGVEDYFPTIELAAEIAGAAEPFMLTSVVNNGVAGNVVGVEAGEGGISYLFTVSAECALNAGTALPVLSLDGQDKFGTANIIAYGEKEAYIRFMETEQYYFTEPGTYVLSIPEGTFVNEEGTPNAAVSLVWVVIENDQPTVTEIENVTVGVVTNDIYGSNDSYYTVTMKFNAPEGAAYAYCEGLMVSKDGVPSNIPFMLPDYGFIELDGTNLELVFTDMMKCATDDATFDGDLREAGSYVGEANIYFMDANYMELASYAHYTGSLYFEPVGGEPVAEGNACFDNEEYHSKYGWIEQNWKTDGNGEYTLPNFLDCGFDLVVTFAEDGTYEYSAPGTFSRVYGNNWCLLDNGYGSYLPFYPNGVGAEEYDYLLFMAPVTGQTFVAEDANGKYLSLGACWTFGAEVIALKVYLDEAHNLTPTGVENIASAKASDNAIYNLNGVKAEKVNGFVISNGKIMFVK